MAANEKDLVKLDAQEIERSQPIMDIAQIMQKAEQMISITNRIKKACIQLTNENDWDNLGGKPYLEAAGAEKYILPFGIRSGNPLFEYEEFNDDKGFYYMYTCTVDVALPNGDTVSGVGTCDSRDRFFSKVRGEDKELSEIKKGDIKKKAYTNARANGIKFLLGLRNLSWDDLSEHGIDISALTKVEYGKKETKKKPGRPAKTSNMPKEEMIDDIDGMITRLSDGNEIKYAELLLKYTTYKDYPTAQSLDILNKWSDTRIQVIHANVKKDFDQLPDESGDMFPEAEKEPGKPF